MYLKIEIFGSRSALFFGQKVAGAKLFRSPWPKLTPYSERSKFFNSGKTYQKPRATAFCLLEPPVPSRGRKEVRRALLPKLRVKWVAKTFVEASRDDPPDIDQALSD